MRQQSVGDWPIVQMVQSVVYQVAKVRRQGENLLTRKAEHLRTGQIEVVAVEAVVSDAVGTGERQQPMQHFIDTPFSHRHNGEAERIGPS